MKNLDSLSGFLARLNAGERSAELIREIQDYLVSIEPRHLYLAEQQLLAAGLTPDDLVHRCSSNTEMVREEIARVQAALEPDHLIGMLTHDHEVALNILDDLERLNDRIQHADLDRFERELRGPLVHTGRRLLALDPHHDCEEDVVFPEIERRGEFGPPQAMRLEHEEITRKIRSLIESSQSPVDPDAFEGLKRTLDTVVKFILFIERDHIFKEVYVLYPAALRAIPDRETWDDLVRKCTGVGYCRI